jgi:hypothetical protein
MKKIYLFFTVVVCFFNQNIYSQQCRNSGGNSPQQPATIYIGDVGTFGHDSWATYNGNWPQWQMYIHTSSDINNGTSGSLSTFSNVENKTSISPRFTSTGTWYWGMRVLYSSDVRWYCRNDSNWNNMWGTPTSNLTITVYPLENPSNPISITNVSDSQLTLNWTKWNSKNVMIVRRLTSAAISNAPTAGTAYSVGVGAPQLGTGTVVYNSNGTSFTDTNLSPGQSYTYTLYSENYSYYSSGISSSGVTSVTWNGTSWSNTNGPTSSLDAIIAENFSSTSSGDTAGFTAKTLTVNSSKTFTINSGHTVTVAGAITNNNGTFNVENNANLVQTNTTTVTNSGNIIVKRNSANIQLYDYTLWSSPVAGQNLKSFSPNTLDSRFYSYDSSQNLYSAVDPLSTSFSPATGYLIRAPNTWTASTPTTFNSVFTGVPNNGTITLTGLTPNKFYAVGNPYPSSISATSFINGNSTSGTLYFWRKTNGASGSAYATRTNAGGTASGGLTPTDNIGVGQGFIVKTEASATTLSFNNTMRTSSNSLVFLRTNEERNRYWLNLNTPTEFICQTLVAYMPEATASVDSAIDGKYINDAPVALTSLINSEEYTIQGRALPFSTTDNVPLGFKTNVAGNYTISIDHVDGFFSTGQVIFLKDNLLNTVNDLSAGSYSFASAVGTFNSRFEIVYQRVLGVNNPEFTSNNVVVFNDKGDIRINSGSAVMEQVRVYDLQGRLLVEKKQINTTETKITTTAANQVLLIEITALNGHKVTKKIIQ